MSAQILQFTPPENSHTISHKLPAEVVELDFIREARKATDRQIDNLVWFIHFELSLTGCSLESFLSDDCPYNALYRAYYREYKRRLKQLGIHNEFY